MPFALVGIMLFIALIAGCMPEVAEVQEKQATARIELFKECMELSAAIKRQADDDVSDIVKACSNEASVMSKGIK